MKVKKIISGGQTGADQGGLSAGVILGLETGGTMPKGFRTEDGDKLQFAAIFDMTEHSSRSYVPRTELNVKDSDGTIIIGDNNSVGSKLTIDCCKIHKKPYYRLAWSHKEAAVFNADCLLFRKWLIDNKITTLNVAGNRETKNPGVGIFTKDFLVECLEHE